MLEFLKALLFGIVEGITEWLPISSTGHLILLDEFVRLDASDAFKEMFEVVIQLGAIMAVVVLYFHKLNPFSPKKTAVEKKSTWSLWFKVVVACLPSAIIALPFDDIIDATFYNYITVSITLILYGILFIVAENMNKKRTPAKQDISDFTYMTAVFIGFFQLLAVIPGTSRSGATIVGAILIGCSRSAAAEFSFFLAIPTMVGASLFKMLKFLMEGEGFSGNEIMILVVAMVSAFAVSLAAIKFLTDYVKRHDFKVFGIYRIILGIIVIAYFLLKTFVLA